MPKRRSDPSEIPTNTPAKRLCNQQKSLFHSPSSIEIDSFQQPVCVQAVNPSGLPGELKLYNARKDLSSDSTPQSIVGRESEVAAIYQFLRSNVRQRVTNCSPLLISGVPGIGKTMAVKSTLARCQRKSEFSFRVIEINTMKLKQINDLIPALLSQILGRDCKMDKFGAAKLLDRVFRTGKSGLNPSQSDRIIMARKVLVLDEVDYLVSNSYKEIVYCILDWLSAPYTNMLAIFISNTLTLSIYQSRLGMNTLVFKPYSCQDMMRIVQDKLTRLDVFSSRALEYAIKRLAISSTDIRKLMHLMELSVEVCIKAEDACVQIHHIKEAYGRIYSNHVAEMIRLFQPFEKLILLSICIEIKFSQVCYSNCLFRRLMHSKLSYEYFTRTLSTLRELQIIRYKSVVNNHQLVQKIELLLEREYVTKALQDQHWLGPFLMELIS